MTCGDQKVDGTTIYYLFTVHELHRVMQRVVSVTVEGDAR
jgi:hypothetical protein